MTEQTITVQEAFKSKTKFTELMTDYNSPLITSTLADYPKANGTTVIQISDLTQNIETLLNVLADPMLQNMQKPPLLSWIVTNEREKCIDIAKTLNMHSSYGMKIFVFKAILNDDKIDFECLLKPDFKAKAKKRTKNENTPTKLLQKTYWEQYIDICDASEYPEMQIKEALPRHYQYVSIGKAGFQILQTVNTVDGYVASEILISNNKSMFEFFYDLKEKIEKELGTLEWDSKETNKSSKIRKIFKADINHTDNFENIIQEHVKMGAQLKAIVHKYL